MLSTAALKHKRSEDKDDGSAAKRVKLEDAPSAAQQAVLGSDDMLAVIAQFLSAPDKCKADRCLLVCKAWLRVCRSPAAWHSVSALCRQNTDESNYLHTRLANVVPYLGRALQNLFVDSTVQDGHLVVPQLLDKCINLRRLVAVIPPDRLVQCAQTLSELQFLSINKPVEQFRLDLPATETASANQPLPEALFKKLRVLTTNWSSREARRLRINCPSLTNFIGRATCDLLDCLWAHSPHLVELSCAFFTITQTDRNSMADIINAIGPQLLSVEIPRIDAEPHYHGFEFELEWYRGVLDAMSRQCSALQDLTIWDADMVVRPAFVPLLTQVFTTCGNGLTQLRMSPCTGLTNEILKEVLSRCPNLEVLYLSMNNAVSDIGLSAIWTHCPLIEDLELQVFTALTEPGLVLLASMLPRLRSMQASTADFLYVFTFPPLNTVSFVLSI